MSKKKDTIKSAKDVGKFAKARAEELMGKLFEVQIKKSALEFAARTHSYYDARSNSDELGKAYGLLLSTIISEEARLWAEFYAIASLAPPSSTVRKRAQKTAIRALLEMETAFDDRRSLYWVLKTHSTQLDIPFNLENMHIFGGSYTDKTAALKQLDTELLKETIEKELMSIQEEDNSDCEPNF